MLIKDFICWHMITYLFWQDIWLTYIWYKFYGYLQYFRYWIWDFMLYCLSLFLYYIIILMWYVGFLLDCKAHTPQFLFFFSELHDAHDWQVSGWTNKSVIDIQPKDRRNWICNCINFAHCYENRPLLFIDIEIL